MGKIEKKRAKLQERIDSLELDLVESLTKKSSNVREIDIAAQRRKINEAKLELQKLK